MKWEFGNLGFQYLLKNMKWKLGNMGARPSNKTLNDLESLNLRDFELWKFETRTPKDQATKKPRN